MMDELLEAKRLAARLRRIRLERGLSLRGAALKIGVTKETLSDLERARRHPHPPTLAKIAEGYGVEISDLLGPMVEEPVALADAPEAGQTEAEVEEERRVIPQAVSSLNMYIKDMKELKELREAEMEELGKGVGLRKALLNQMYLADKGLRDSLKVEGVLDFAEAVRAGRAMAQPEAIRLCHQLLGLLDGLERLSAEARAASGVAEANIWVGGVKTASGAESFLAEQTAPEGS